MSAMVDADGGIASPVEGEDTFSDDLRNDKKKKFKPFQKMRNFFRGNSKKRLKPEEAAGQKSRSTSALQHPIDEDEDDDGGFRSKPMGLAGSRSISEDSIFKPEPKELTPGVLDNKTVSMENIDTNPFQSELFAKLRSRQSDLDIDEGLPYSPMTTLTPHGLMFDTGRKSVPAVGKSTSQESEQSLISVDGSDEDLFSNNWKSGVASVKTARSVSLDSLPENTMDVNEFEAVQLRTMSLSNEAAKHRISVKPKSRRLSAKMSVRKRERSPVSPQLPDVKEESPTKTQNDDSPEPKYTFPLKTIISTTIPIGPQTDSIISVIPRSEPRDIPGRADIAGVTMTSQAKDMARSEPRDTSHAARHGDEIERNRPRSMSPLSTSPVSQSMLQEVKLRHRPASGKFETEDMTKYAEDPRNELTKAFTRAKRISKKFDGDGNVVDINSGKSSVMVLEKEMEANRQIPVPLSKEETKTIPVTSPVKDSSVSPKLSSSVSGVTFVLKKEPLRPGNKSESAAYGKVNNEPKDVQKSVAVDMKTTIIETPKSVTIRTTTSEENVKDIKSVEKVELSIKGQKLGSPEKLASPREDYRLKRAARSKTLPVSKDIMEKAEEAERRPTSGSSPFGNQNRNDYENVVTGVKATSIQSKRSSWASPSATTANSSSAEPAWVIRARVKQVEQDKKTEDKVDAAKEVKVEVKRVSHGNVFKNENVENEGKTVDKSSSEHKADISKGTVQAGGVKSWAHIYSAKPFEKPTATVASKPSVTVGVVKSSVEKTTVHSVKPPFLASSEQHPKATDSISSKPSVAITNSTKTSLQNTKPAVSTVSRPAVSSAISKPAVSGFTKPSVTSSSKTTVTATITSNADKLTQSSKTSVSVSGTLSADKQFSQSVRSDGKTSGFGGVSAASSSISKSLTVANKTGQDAKPMTQPFVKPFSASKTKSKETLNKPTSVNSITKTSIHDNKKCDNDLKNANTTPSTVKSGSSFDKSKPSFSSSSTKLETSKVVPSWKQALNQKKNTAGTQHVKIEIINKDAEKMSQTPQRRVDEKPVVVQMREKPKPAPEKCSDVAANRPSKVLDMVKSFQKLQVT